MAFAASAVPGHYYPNTPHTIDPTTQPTNQHIICHRLRVRQIAHEKKCICMYAIACSYSNRKEDMTKTHLHLTNNAIQKKADGYGQAGAAMLING